MNYRLISACAALMALATMQAINLPELPAKEGYKIKGYVYTGSDSDCKGVEGVKVTDGLNFAVTDATGAYYLPAAEDTKYVSLVLPAGYELPANKVTAGVGQLFYQPYDAEESNFQADFEIVPHGDDTKFSFLVHADTQPNTFYNSECYHEMGKGYADMQKTANALKSSEGFMPLCLHLGDIISNPTQQEFKTFALTLSNYGYTLPIYATPGNHDHVFVNNFDDATELYRSYYGPTHCAFERGNVYFIMLDNVTTTDGNYGRGLNGSQFQWVKNYIQYIEKGSTIVISAHLPLTRNKTAINAYGPMLRMLADYNVLLLTGHIHSQGNLFPVFQENMRERNHVAHSGYKWRPGGISPDGIPWGYFIYEADGPKISWKYKPFNADADKSLFRLYTPGQFEDYEPSADEPKTIKVNVWDWDENWSVTWQLDGVPQGDLPRYETAKDPRASYNYDNIATQPDWSAAETYHIFYANIPPTGAEVTVTAIDPFGRKMSKTIELDHVNDGLVTITPESCGIESTEIFTVQGVKIMQTQGYPQLETLPCSPGVYVLVLHKTDGTTSVEKTVI